MQRAGARAVCSKGSRCRAISNFRQVDQRAVDCLRPNLHGHPEVSKCVRGAGVTSIPTLLSSHCATKSVNSTSLRLDHLSPVRWVICEQKPTFFTNYSRKARANKDSIIRVQGNGDPIHVYVCNCNEPYNERRTNIVRVSVW